jgi:cytochrome d ubiquinol oxidase subunit II
MDWAIVWYVILGFAMLAYAVLDGFDLGVGALHLFARGDQQRRIFLNAIGPVWDGNEVWIVIVMGGLFAGFPNAYATVFSGFYTLLMFLIAGLMFRASAIEFRSKREGKGWRYFWDVVFSLSSILVGLIMGVILGNVIEGIALNQEQEFVGQFSDFFRPYALIVGVTAMSLFAMHGTIYLAMKTEGEAHEVVRKWIGKAILVFIFWYLVTSVATVVYMPHMVERILSNGYFWIFPVLALLMILNIHVQVRKGNDGWAFVSSCVSIALLLVLFSLGTFPTIVRSIPESHNVTIYNAASSEKTLKILTVVVATGLPMVLAYLAWTYRVFKGKVKLEKNSY